jgi:hypothetical protein
MPTSTKTEPKKQTAEVSQKPEAAKQKPIDILASKAGDIFAKIKAKAAGIDSKKIDEFQKSWLTVPENRKKYEHLIDAPEVAAEEILAMTNDIIDYCQGQSAGQSHVFKNLKEKGAKFLHGPIETLKQTIGKGKQAAAAKAGEHAGKAKPVVRQTKTKNGQAKTAVKKIK